MSQPEEPIEERFGGWLRVAALSVLTVGGPVWVLGTAIVIQLSPALNGTVEPQIDGWPTAMHPSTWFYAGRMVGAWLCFAMPFLLAAIMLGRFAWEAARLKSQSERARYDAMVANEAVIDDPSWRAEEPPAAPEPPPVDPSSPDPPP